MGLALDNTGASLSVQTPVAGQPPTPQRHDQQESSEQAEVAGASQAATTSGAYSDDSDAPATAEVNGQADLAENPATQGSIGTSEASVKVSATASDVIQAEASSAADTDVLAEMLDNQSEANDVRSLSVEPGAHPLLPADRPAWVGAAPDFSGEIHRFYVESIPVANRDKVDEALDERLVEAVRTYAEQEVFQREGAADDLDMSVDYIRRNLINEPDGYVAELTTSDGPMYQKWVTLEVTPAQRDQLQQWHRESLQRERMSQVAVGLIALFGVVGLLHVVIRGRHVPATSQPFRPHAEAQPPTSEVRKPKSGLTFSLVALGVLLLPAMLLAAGLMSWTVARQSPAKTQRVHVHALPDIPDIPEIPDIPDLPGMPHIPRIEVRRVGPQHHSGSHESSNIIKIDTGNQEVIITPK
jgi:hypothetical protein